MGLMLRIATGIALLCSIAFAQQIAVGVNHTCMIECNGHVSCWGSNQYGALNVPGILLQTPSTQIRANGTVTCATTLANGTVVCWGHPQRDYTLQAPEWLSLPPQTQQPTLYAQWSQGPRHGCGIRAVDNTVHCVGANEYGQASVARGQYQQLSSSMLGQHVCGIRLDRSADCWGNRTFNQTQFPRYDTQQPSNTWRYYASLYDDDDNGMKLLQRAQVTITMDRARRTAVSWNTWFQADTNVAVTQLSAGVTHTCALRANQRVQCWGDNRNGQLNVPARSTFVAIAAGNQCTCGIRACDALLQCWGHDTFGVVAQYPSAVPFLTVSMGETFACAIRKGSGPTPTLQQTVRCWGDNSYRQVSGAPTVSLTDVSCGLTFACGLTLSGRIVCWGNTALVTPPALSATTTGFSRIRSGRTHACALRDSDATLLCFGSDVYSQVSRPMQYIQSLALAPPQSTWLQDVVCGPYVTCLLVNSTVRCFGDPRHALLASDTAAAADDDNATVAPPPNRAAGMLAPQYYWQSRFDTWTRCAPGRYSSYAGATSAVCSGLCGAGQYDRPDSATATTTSTANTGWSTSPLCTGACPAGYYCPNGTVDFTDWPCPAGRFGATSALADPACSGACTAGTYAPLSATTACLLCPTAQIASWNGTYCHPLACPAGQFPDSTRGVCRDCPAGTFSIAGGVSCASCHRNSYASLNGSQACVSCASTLFASVQIPTIATHLSSVNSANHLQCTANDGLATIDAGYWGYMVNNITGEIRLAPCPGGISMCVGASIVNLDKQCGAHRKLSHTNVLCGECLDGYTEWAGVCVPCVDLATQAPKPYAHWLVLIVVVLWAYTWAFHQMWQTSLAVCLVFFYYIQVALYMMASASSARPSLRWTFVFSLDVEQTSAGSNTCIAPWSAWAKVTMEFVVPMVLIALAAFNALCHWAFQRVCMRNTSTARGCAQKRRRCRTIYKRHCRFDALVYVRTCVAITLVTYYPTLSACLHYMQCIALDNGIVVMFTEPTISCRSAEYTHRLGAIMALALVCLGWIPTLIVLVLNLHRHTYTATTKSTVIHQSQFQPASAAASVLPLNALQAVTTTTVTTTDMTVRLTSPTIHWTVRRIMEWHPVTGVWFDCFRPERYWWLCTLLCRYAIVAILDTFLFLNPTVKYMALCFCHIVALLIHVHASPFATPFDNALETASLVLLTCLASFMAAFPDAAHAAPQTMTLPFDLIFDLVILVPVSVATTLVLTEYCRRRHRERQAQQRRRQRIDAARWPRRRPMSWDETNDIPQL